MENNSPVYGAVNKILDLFDIDNKVKVYSYKDEAHFKELWNFHNIANSSGPPMILVVWDGIPSGKTGGVNTSKYLTPIDWAVGYSLSINNKATGLNCYPDSRIIILDVDSQSVSDSDSLKFVYQSSNMDIMSMPWIRIFSAKTTDSRWDIDAFFRNLANLGAGGVGLIDSDSDSLESASGTIEVDDTPTLSPPSSETFFETRYSEQDTEIRDETLLSMKDAFEKEPRDLAITKNMWAAFLTRPSTHGDHHAIANLVGPLLLMEEAGGDLHVNALQALMSSIGLLPDHKEGNTSKENGDAMLCAKNPWVDVKEYNSDKLKLILIDDMFKVGWGEILCRAVGLDYKEPSWDDGKNQLVEISEHDAGQGEKIVVKAASSAEWILEKLDKLGDKTDERFEFSLDGDGTGQEILFLDLRLYSGESKLKTQIAENLVDIKGEVAFLIRLIALARKFTGGEQNKNLPWPGITNDEIVKIQNWIDNPDRKQENSEYIKALTLLPRILALTDLSLPIVLFSSTGRRDITEILKPYGNIITVFEKPRFTVDIPLDIALQTKRKFQDAMEMAHMILQARQKCRTIIATGSKVASGVGDTDGKGYHIELFIDESFPQNTRTNTILVGGLFAIYSADSVSDARKKADDFDDELVKAGVRYFDSLGVGVKPKTGAVKRKKNSCCAELTKAFEHDHKPDHSFFVMFECTMSAEGERDNYFHPNSGDNLYRMTLNSIIEFFLSETIPALFPKRHKEVSISIYVATRVERYPLKAEERLNLAKFKTGFGSLSAKSKETGDIIEYFLYSMSRDSLFPIISDILSHHNLERNIHRVAGITYAYHPKGEPKYFVCRGCKKVVHIKPHEINQKKIPQKPPLLGNRTVNRKFLTCKCSSPAFYPDYRALHYVADELLNHVEDVKSGKGYGTIIKLSDFGFNDTLEKAKNTLIASRYFDMKDIVSSIVQVNLDNIGRHSITHFLLRRQAVLLNSISGSDFCRIAAKQASDDRVTEYQFTQFLRGRGKKSHPTKSTQQEEEKALVVTEICKTPVGGRRYLICHNREKDTVKIMHRQTKGLGPLKKGDEIYACVKTVGGEFRGFNVSREKIREDKKRTVHTEKEDKK